MKLALTINTFPMSLNNFQKSTRSGRRYTTALAREWQDFIYAELTRQNQKINDFRKKIDKETRFSCRYSFYLGNFLTKKSTLNRKSIDLSNSIKHLEDIIFAAIGADDSMVIELFVTKKQANENFMIVEIEAI